MRLDFKLYTSVCIKYNNISKGLDMNIISLCIDNKVTNFVTQF